MPAKTANSILDPVTDLPLVLKVGEGYSGGTTSAFEKALFRRRDVGASVVLFLKMVKRYNKKGKGFDRMLIVSRTYVIVAYAGEKLSAVRHADAIATRCIPISQIRELVIFSLDTPVKLGLRVAEPKRPQYDLLLSFHDPSDIDEVVGILKTCAHHSTPPFSLATTDYRHGHWSACYPPFNLAKPDGWTPPRTEEKMIPLATYAEISKADAERRKPNVSEKTQNTAIQVETPEGSPEYVGLQLPPTPPSRVVEMEGEREVEAVSAGVEKEIDPMVLRKQIEELKEQSTMLSAQQKLHVATLGASQKVVNMIVDNSTRPPPPPAPPPLSDVASEINFAPYNRSVSSSVDSDLVLPLPPSPRPPIHPPPLSDVSEGGEGVAALEAELAKVRREMEVEMEEKERQIGVLRGALEGVLNEEESEEEHEEEEEEDEIWPSPEPRAAPTDDELLAGSIESRRQEIENLLAHLEVIEADPSHANSSSVPQLRSQLRALLNELEVEALSYQDCLLTSSPTPSPPRRLSQFATDQPPEKDPTTTTPSKQWAEYLTHLATYYPAAYASFYEQYNLQYGAAQQDVQNAGYMQPLDRDEQWKKWKTVMSSQG